jgi:hypothetical protein
MNRKPLKIKAPTISESNIAYTKIKNVFDSINDFKQLEGGKSLLDIFQDRYVRPCKKNNSPFSDFMRNCNMHIALKKKLELTETKLKWNSQK